jgi:hypothetical protein
MFLEFLRVCVQISQSHLPVSVIFQNLFSITLESEKSDLEFMQP